MTAAVATDLAALFHRARYLLLDFDGPICAIFASRPALVIARDLVDGLRADGELVPDHIDFASDPFDVLRFANTLSPAAAERTEARLRAAEFDAVKTASPTLNADQLITTWRSTDRRVAAVSNNAQSAVAEYLALRSSWGVKFIAGVRS